ncbi:MAG: PD-(D/E)XK motif protein [Planctomycetes bacterium]|nr:PD-(D/E)XK motif protein [Planctomycetota bacterium]
MSHSYETIRERLSSILPPAEQSRYAIEWLVPKKLAVGRDAREGFAIFIIGAGITSRLPLVAAAAKSAKWQDDAGEAFVATRLLLPAGEHFRAAAAAVAAEFIQRGMADRDPCVVFEETEPLVDLIFSRVFLPVEAVLGLLGELIVLRLLLEALRESGEDFGADPTYLWFGHAQKSRDFAFGRTAIEVKTTVGFNSQHRIGSLAQIEPRTFDDGMRERLFLVSIGLRSTPDGKGRSIAGEIDKILGLLAIAGVDRSDAQQAFLDKVQRYGPSTFVGYVHDVMKDDEPYSRGYDLAFPLRLYDLTDDKVLLPRRADLEQLYVLPDSVSFSVDLPEVIPGSPENPLELTRSICRELLDSGG